jgi:hypothetical protein
MSADHSSDPGRQRTVAELLAQYSDDGGGGGRRRRRSAEREPDPAPGDQPGAESAAEQSWSSFSALTHEEERGAPAAEPPASDASGWGGLSGYGEPSTYDSAGSRAAPENNGASEWARPGRAEVDPRRGAFGGAEPYRPGTYSDTYSGNYPDNGPVNGIYSADSYAPPAPVAPPVPPNVAPPAQAAPPPSSVAPPAAPPPAAPPAAPVAPREPRRREPTTEQMPRYAERPGASPARATPSGFDGPPTAAQPTVGMPTRAGRPVADSGPSTEVSPAALLEDTAERETDDGYDGYDDDVELDDGPEEPREPPATRAGGRRSARTALASRPADVPAGLAPEDAELVGEPEPVSGLKAWGVLIAQGIGGAVGGALLWVGFRWLWLHLPVVALAAAVLATAGLVLIVRTIRGSDDVQTTMLAVLVGLIVTISPAVLLLALH